jgi:DNA-binding PadR family transcriptional regulator
MPADADVYEILRLELRRGSLILAVLGLLRAEHYGYTLRKALAAQGVEIDEGALYPMLRRLESQGLLTSTWREEDKRNKRFYRLSPEGDAVLQRLEQDWRSLNLSIEGILEEERDESRGSLRRGHRP